MGFVLVKSDDMWASVWVWDSTLQTNKSTHANSNKAKSQWLGVHLHIIVILFLFCGMVEFLGSDGPKSDE